MDEKKRSPLSPISLPRQSLALNVDASDISNDVACCGRPTNPKLISFSVKVGISVMILGFSMYKLHKSPSCDCSEESAVYVSLLASVMSAWLGKHTL